MGDFKDSSLMRGSSCEQFGEGTHCNQMQAFVILLRMLEAFALFFDSSFSLNRYSDP